MRHRKPPEFALPRRLLHRLISARTEHGDFVAYHRRLNHVDAYLECVYGWETTLAHFIFRRHHSDQMRELRNVMNMDTFKRYLLGVFPSADKLLEDTRSSTGDGRVKILIRAISN